MSRQQPVPVRRINRPPLLNQHLRPRQTSINEVRSYSFQPRGSIHRSGRPVKTGVSSLCRRCDREPPTMRRRDPSEGSTSPSSATRVVPLPHHPPTSAPEGLDLPGVSTRTAPARLDYHLFRPLASTFDSSGRCPQSASGTETFGVPILTLGPPTELPPSSYHEPGRREKDRPLTRGLHTHEEVRRWEVCVQTDVVGGGSCQGVPPCRPGPHVNILEPHRTTLIPLVSSPRHVFTSGVSFFTPGLFPQVLSVARPTPVTRHDHGPTGGRPPGSGV